MKVVAVVLSSLLLAIVGACATAQAPEPPPTTPPPEAPALRAEADSILVTGTHGGKALRYQCVRPGADLGGDTTAMRLNEAMIVLSCLDESTRFQLHAVLISDVHKVDVLPDESNGRLGLIIPAPDGEGAPLDIITTSERSRDDATRSIGSYDIAEWNPDTGRLVGTARMTWQKDKLGQAGEMAFAFDLTLPSL